MAIMAVSNLLFWGLVVAGVVVLVRHLGRSVPSTEDAPKRVLAERYARGEIDDEEYRRRLGVLGR